MKEGSTPPPDDDFQREDAALWDLLGKTPTPRASPYFARRVVREAVRLEEEGGGLRRLLAGWRLPHAAWSGAVAAGLLGAVSLNFAFHPPSGGGGGGAGVFQNDPREEISPGDVEVIANLDNLMAYEENRIWTDEPNTD